MNRGKFIKEWQVTDTIIEWICLIYIQPFANDSKLKK